MHDNASSTIPMKNHKNRHEQLPQELQEQRSSADAGEAAAVFLHDLGNALNNLLLDMRLMQRELPEEQRERLTESCKIVVETARQMQQLAEYRQQCRPETYTVELGRLIGELFEEKHGFKDRIMVKLANTPLLVRSTTAEMKRLLRLLMDNLSRTLGETDQLEVILSNNENSAVLQFHFVPAMLSSADLTELFHPFSARSLPCNPLELAVSQNLVRKNGGTMQVRGDAPGEFEITITLPLS